MTLLLILLILLLVWGGAALSELLYIAAIVLFVGLVWNLVTGRR